MKKRLLFVGVLLLLLAMACTPPSTTAVPTLKPVDNPDTMIDESVTPGKDQPAFSTLGKHWVADPNGDCGFTKDTALWAHEQFEELRTTQDIWVAVLCQPGIKKISGMNDERIWMVDWVRWFQLGSAENDWAVFIVFRPDVTPEEHRVLIERTYGLTWFSPVVYMPIIEEAAQYTNVDDFDGALESIVRNIDELVELTMYRKGTPSK